MTHRVIYHSGSHWGLYVTVNVLLMKCFHWAVSGRDTCTVLEALTEKRSGLRLLVSLNRYSGLNFYSGLTLLIYSLIFLSLSYSFIKCTKNSSHYILSDGGSKVIHHCTCLFFLLHVSRFNFMFY